MSAPVSYTHLKVHLEGNKYSTKKLNEDRTQLAGEVAEYKESLSAVQELSLIHI